MPNQQTNIPAVPVSTPMFDEHGRLTRTWIIFFEKLARYRAVREVWESQKRFTFGLGIGAPQPVMDPAAPSAIVTPKKGAGKMARVEACSNRPGTGPVYIDILISHDDGVTWASIFPAGPENKIVLTAGAAQPETVVTTFAPGADVAVGDHFKPVVLAGSAEDWQNIEIVGEWE